MYSDMISLLALLSITRIESTSIFSETNKGRCQPIDIPLCKDSPYNYTYYPNTILQHDQQSLQTQTEHFKPLIKTKCHEHIKFFVCSVFAPMCPRDVPQAVTSCRSVCEQVRQDCKAILETFDIGWPEPLNCDRFPEHPDLCMSPGNDHKSSGSSGSGGLSQRGGGGRLKSARTCPADLIDVDPMDANGQCASRCGADVMFGHEDKASTRTWMIVWGCVDLGISIFTFLTFLIDRKRFRFPERCVFYLALCFLLYSVPFLFPLLMSYQDLACDRMADGQTFLVFPGFESTNCRISFVFTYYFSMASNLWWLMFAFTWYLSAGRKWVPEGIDACSSYVHLVAWGGAGVMTIAVLAMHKVDASELSGLCSVGNTDDFSLLVFSLLPRLILTVLGSGFVVAGFASMCRERDSFRQRGTDTSKLEKLMMKMGFFCALYIIPAVIALVCDSYHYLTIRRWSAATIACKASTSIEGAFCQRPPLPQAEIYVLGMMMSLAAGTSCAMWIISPKTLHSWQRFICCGLCSSAPTKQSTSAANGASAASRPLLEPPTAPPPQPPAHYMPMSTHSHSAWRSSKVV